MTTATRAAGCDRQPRLLLVVQGTASHRFWDEAVPLLERRTAGLTVATVFGRGPLHDQLASLGCHAFALGCATSRDYPGASLRLAAFVRSRAVDVVQGTESVPAAVGGVAGLLARRGLRVFHRQHCYFEGNRTLTAICRVASKTNHVTLACSHSSAAYARTLDRVPAERTAVAHNAACRTRAVPLAEVADLRARLGIPDEAAVVGAVARLRVEKGLDTLIEATADVQARLDRPAHLVVVGDGPDGPRLHGLARQRPELAAHFVGFQEDVAPWFAAADVVAIPSHREAFGIAGAEAMSCGRPLVASAVGGLTELVDDGVTGILVPPRDPPRLAEALLDILRSPAAARRMGAQAQRRFEERFTTEAMVAGWFDCYRAFSAVWKR